MGDRYNGEVCQSYYWVKNLNRYHKSGLRKKKSELKSNKTEYELREEQGFSRIWDLGKKRWVFNNVKNFSV
jgi:hypothetical protein